MLQYMHMGTMFALIAFVSWGVGDFLIQKSTRKFGDWISLFFISATASVAFLPFMYKEIPALLQPDSYNDLGILILASLVSTVAALLLFEGLKEGKIAVVEPIFAFEIPVVAFLAWVFLKETLTISQIGLIVILVLGIFLISIKSFNHLRQIKLEKAVLLTIFATIAMGAENLLYGIGARVTSPLLVNWFTSLCITIITLGYIVYRGQFSNIAKDYRKDKWLVLMISGLDNVAWLSYSFAAVYLPIAIVTGISEGYIALAVLLGLVVNKEKLKLHQRLGLIFTLVATILLALTLG